MSLWTYTIKTAKGFVLTTTDPDIAEKKSRHGCCVYCKRTTNVFRYPH